jgi:hypothetical protein
VVPVVAGSSPVVHPILFQANVPGQRRCEPENIPSRWHRALVNLPGLGPRAGKCSGRGHPELRRLPLSKSNRSITALPHLLLWLLILTLALCPSCEVKKKQAEPQKQTVSYDLVGEWHSDIESGDRIITKSVYQIEQKADTVMLKLVSTKSPQGDELVPGSMWFEAKGAWQDDALRFTVSSWISGRDTCTFPVKGEMDKEGSFLLHFPGDLCGEKSLPYTRKLYRAEQTPE